MLVDQSVPNSGVRYSEVLLYILMHKYFYIYIYYSGDKILDLTQDTMNKEPTLDIPINEVNLMDTSVDVDLIISTPSKFLESRNDMLTEPKWD